MPIHVGVVYSNLPGLSGLLAFLGILAVIAAVAWAGQRGDVSRAIDQFGSWMKKPSLIFIVTALVVAWPLGLAFGEASGGNSDKMMSGVGYAALFTVLGGLWWMWALNQKRAERTNDFRLDNPPPLRMSDGSIVIKGLTALGGSGYDIVPRQRYSISFFSDWAEVVRDQTKDRRVIPYEEMHSLEIGGRGEVTSGGGFIGGGFGLGGAAKGMAIATVLNAITTSTSVETILRIATPHGEAFFHYAGATPSQLRLALSAPVTRVSGVRPAERPAEAGIAAELEKLTSLRDSGALTEEEFSLSKKRLLDP